MQLLVDLLPVLLFFAAYKMAGIYVATSALIVGVLALTLVIWVRHREVKPMLLATAGIALVFGGLTLYLRDPAFIKWKPTIVSWLFAIVFLASQFTRGPNLMQRMMGAQLPLDPPGLWTRVNLAWVGFNVVMGALNLWVAFTFAESTWVNFKLFGLMGLTLVFALLLGVWIARKSEHGATGPTAATPRAE